MEKTSYLQYRLYSFFLFFFLFGGNGGSGTGVQTQGFVLARQTFYCLSHVSRASDTTCAHGCLLERLHFPASLAAS
jgi:hypothetical protein